MIIPRFFKRIAGYSCDIIFHIPKTIVIPCKCSLKRCCISLSLRTIFQLRLFHHNYSFLQSHDPVRSHLTLFWRFGVLSFRDSSVEIKDALNLFDTDNRYILIDINGNPNFYIIFEGLITKISLTIKSHNYDVLLYFNVAYI